MHGLRYIPRHSRRIDISCAEPGPFFNLPKTVASGVSSLGQRRVLPSCYIFRKNLQALSQKKSGGTDKKGKTREDLMVKATWAQKRPWSQDSSWSPLRCAAGPGYCLCIKLYLLNMRLCEGRVLLYKSCQEKTCDVSSSSRSVCRRCSDTDSISNNQQKYLDTQRKYFSATADVHFDTKIVNLVIMKFKMSR